MVAISNFADAYTILNCQERLISQDAGLSLYHYGTVPLYNLSYYDSF